MAGYQKQRQAQGAGGHTINIEAGTLRSIMRRNRLWANLQPDVKMLPEAARLARNQGCYRVD